MICCNRLNAIDTPCTRLDGIQPSRNVKEMESMRQTWKKATFVSEHSNKHTMKTSKNGGGMERHIASEEFK